MQKEKSEHGRESWPIQWLWEETHVLKGVSLNPSTVNWMDIFHIYYKNCNICLKKRPQMAHLKRKTIKTWYQVHTDVSLRAMHIGNRQGHKKSKCKSHHQKKSKLENLKMLTSNSSRSKDEKIDREIIRKTTTATVSESERALVFSCKMLSILLQPFNKKLGHF